MKSQQTKTRMLVVAAGLCVAAMTASSAFAHDKMMGGADMMSQDMMSKDMMTKIDTDHDGSISAAEHSAYWQSMFDKMDANHDGMVTKAEMDAGMKMMHGEHMKNDKMEDEAASMKH